MARLTAGTTWLVIAVVVCFPPPPSLSTWRSPPLTHQDRPLAMLCVPCSTSLWSTRRARGRWATRWRRWRSWALGAWSSRLRCPAPLWVRKGTCRGREATRVYVGHTPAPAYSMCFSFADTILGLQPSAEQRAFHNCMHPPPFASWHHLRNHALHFMCLQGAAHSGRSSSAKSAAETSAAHACARTPCSAVGSLAVPVSSVSQSILAVQRDAHICILTEKDCTICGQWHTHRYLLWHALHCIAAMRKPTPSLHFHGMHSSKAA